MEAEEVESRPQTAEDRAREVAGVQGAEPADATRRALDPARDRGQGRTHQDGRRQEAQPGDRGAHDDAPESVDP